MLAWAWVGGPDCPALPPAQPLQNLFPQQASPAQPSPRTRTGDCLPTPTTSLGKYLLLTPRSDGMRLVKPWGFVGRDLIVGPWTPGAGRGRILDSS